jgi:hypothetical protein
MVTETMIALSNIASQVGNEPSILRSVRADGAGVYGLTFPRVP